MAEDSSQERTEQPSEKRRRKFRQEGRVATSRDLGSLVVLAAGLAALGFSLRPSGEHYLSEMRAMLGSLHLWRAGGGNEASPHVINLLRASGPLVLVPLAAALVAGIAVNLTQNGLLWTPKSLMPKAARINPLSRAKQIFFSAQTAAELLKSVGKLVLVACVAYWAVSRDIERMPGWTALPVPQLVAEILLAMLRLAALLVAAMIPPALGDLLFTRWDHGRKLKMTKQEVKEEVKEREGDPHIKAQRRRRARELSQNRMIGEVSNADLVVVNPTHYAVALRYRRDEGSAPRVLAKGVDRVAARIRQEARKNAVPVLEEKPLARALYRSTRVGQAIPGALFQAVAELLAVVYRMRAERGLRVPL